MFDHFTIDSSAAAGRAADPDDGDSSPIEPPSPPLRDSTSPPIQSRSTSPVDPNRPPSGMDNLVQRMNRQNLWLDGLGIVPHAGFLPSSPALSDRPSLPPLLELEADDQPLPVEPDSLQTGPGQQPPLADPLSLSPIEVDELEPDPAPPVLDTKRLRRQLSGQINNSDGTKTIHALMEDMIASGSQCRVHMAPPPPPTPTSLHRLAPILEPDDDLNLLCVDLEVDEAICNEDSWADSFSRGSGTAGNSGFPAGIRKNGILRYRLSLDAAMRCANVERKRPRMRKRKRPGNSNNPLKATPSLASLASTGSSQSLAGSLASLAS